MIAVAAIIVLAVVFSSLPYLAGWWSARRTPWAALGVGLWSAGDSSVYYSYIEQARQGRVLFENQFTTIPQRPRLLFPLWLVLGWVAALTQLPTAAVFHLARMAAIVCVLLALWRFLGRLFPAPRWRLIGLCVVAFSSGLGGLTLLGVGKPPGSLHVSTDLWQAEGNTFFSFYTGPLFPLTQLAIFATLWLFTESQGFDRRWWLAAGLIAVLGFTHTYDVAIVGAALVSLGVARILTDRFRDPAEATAYARRVAALLLPALLAVGYFVWVIATEPAIRGWVVQNITPSPKPWFYLSGYGLLVPLAIIGSRPAMKRHPFGLVLVAWCVVAFILAYLPGVPIQRRFVSGVHLPLAILATFGIRRAWEYARERWRGPTRAVIVSLSIIVVVVGLTMTNAFIIVASVTIELSGGPKDSFGRASDDVVATANWLRLNADQKDGLFASLQGANVLPGLTGRRVAFGHGHQTPNWEVEKVHYQTFLASRLNATEELQYLRQRAVRFFVYDPADQAFAAFNPDVRPYLQPAFRSGTVTVYRVVAGPGPAGTLPSSTAPSSDSTRHS